MRNLNNDPGRDIKFDSRGDKRLEAMIDDYDAKMLGYIANLYQAINGEKMNFDNIQNSVEALQQFNNRQEFNYLNNLLYPERKKGIKIPSPIPVPSCSFQLHNCITLSTNSSGNLGIVFNPFFLSSNQHLDEMPHITRQGVADTSSVKTNFYTSLFVNNDNSLNGFSPNVKWRPVNIGQEIPPVYDQYRLVSASMVIKYIGRLDTVSGVIGGAVVFDETPEIGCNFTLLTNGEPMQTFDYTPNNLAKYGNFDLAMDSFYHQENLCLEGIRELYFPLDNSYEEYVRLMNDNLVNVKMGAVTSVNPSGVSYSSSEDYLKNGFRQMIYVMGAPANTSCFKVDIYCNYECLPTGEFMNYLPLTLSCDPTTAEEKKQASIVVQQKPVMKADEKNENVPETPGIFQRLKSKFANSLPGIAKLLSTGLIKAVPSLQPGTVLANTISLASNAISSFL